MADALLVRKETTRNTFLVPQAGDAVPVMNLSGDTGESYIQSRQTSAGRGLSGNHRGSVKPSGSVEMELIPAFFGKFLMAAGFNERATGIPSGGTTSIEHGFSINDAAAMESLSFQTQEARAGAETVINQKGVVVNAFSLTIAQDALAILAFDYIAQDESLTAVNFADGTSSPAKVTASYPTIVLPFKFDHFSMLVGATPTYDNTDKLFTYTGGTAVTKVTNFTFDFNNNLSHNVHLGSRTGNRMALGNRDISVTFDIDNDIPSTAFYAKYRAGTKECMVITLTSTALAEAGVPYVFEIVLPYVSYSAAPSGELNGEHGERDLSITAVAEVAVASGRDIAIRFVDNVASY